MNIKGIFCHTLPVYKDINGVYCSTTMTNTFFERYFSVVDELVVVTRVYNLDKTYLEAHQEKIDYPNVSFIEFGNINSIRYRFSKEYKCNVQTLKRAIDNSDLVFVRGGTISYLAADYCRKIKKKYLCECGGCAWDEYWNYNLVGKLVAPYYDFKQKKQVKYASFVIYVTEKYLQKRYPTNGRWVNASNVILTDIDEVSLSHRLTKISNSNNKSFVFGTTGGVGNKAKGQQFVIKAVSVLKDKYDIKYELVGGGSNAYLKKIAEQYNVSDKVVFLGELTHEEVLSWLDKIDIYIQPSLQEGLPRSLIEAMSRACPAIGSTTAGTPELLDDDALFKRGNVKELIKVIEYLADSDLSKYAKKNFNKSKEYLLPLLNRKRDSIYKEYKNVVINNEERCN